MNILFLILLTFFQEVPNNRNEIVIDGKTDRLTIGRQTSILEDKSGYLTIAAITKPQLQSRFVPSSQDVIKFPPNNFYYWVKFRIRSATEKKFIIFVDEPKFQRIDLYYRLEGQPDWRQLKNGHSVPHEQKAIAHNSHLFPLSLPEGTRGEFYLHVQPKFIPLPISIEAQENFFEHKNSRYNLILGLILGIIFFIGINNLGIYLSFGGSLRLLYFLTSLSFVLSSLLFNGHIFFVSSFIYERLVPFVLPLSFASQFLVNFYGVKFLQVKKFVPLSYAFSVLFLVVLAIATMLSVFNHEYYMVLCVNITSNLTVINCFLMGLLTLRGNNSVYRSTNLIYCCSYLLFFLCLVGEVGHVFFAWDYLIVAKYVDLGFLCEAVGLSIALNVQTGIDQQLLEDAKNKAQAENLLLVSKQNQFLEVRVNQRTFELQEKTKIAEQLSDEYKLQSEQLKEAASVKDRLFSIISHDLRSPLRQLQGILGLADKDQLSEQELKNLLCQVRTNLGVNIQLTDNLLFWARSQMSGAKINHQDFNLFSVVETKFQFFSQSFDTKKIQASNRIHHGLEIHSDENIVALVIHNLLANAIKFCKQGDTIIVASELKEKETILYVSDTGVGMSAEDIRRILGNDLFTRQGTANEKGTGFGLKICKDLIQQLNGRLWIESQLGEGTTFYFSIPVSSHVRIAGKQGSLQISA